MTLTEDEGLNRSRIHNELLIQLQINPIDAWRLINKDVFSGLSLDDALNVIRTLTDVLGDYYAWVVLEARPYVAKLQVQRLQEHAIALAEQGFGEGDVRNMLGMQIDLVSTTDEQFRHTLTALRELLPDEKDFRLLLRRKPQVLRLTAEHLRTKIGFWRMNGNIETAWNALREGPDLEKLSTEEGFRPTRYIKPAVLPLVEQFVELGLKRSSAELVAVRFSNAFHEQARFYLDVFLKQGWSVKDIERLNENTHNVEWRKNPNRLFTAEQALIAAGFEPTAARHLVTINPRFSQNGLNEEIARASVSAFRELGYDEEQLKRIARENPKTLFVSAEKIRIWHAEMQAAHKDPLTHLIALTVYKPPAMGRRKQRKHLSSTPPDPPVMPEAEPLPPEMASPDAVSEPEPFLAPAPQEPIEVKGILSEAEKPLQMSEERVAKTPLQQKWENIEESDDFAPIDYEIPWKRFLQKLWSHGREDSEEKWQRHSQKNLWLWEATAHTSGVLQILLEWMGNTLPAPEDEGFKFLQRIVREPKLHPILRTPPDTIRHRMAVLRVIVERNFIKDPEFLLLPWESIPETEIKLRVFELERRKRPKNLKPFIHMLLEPQLSGPLRRNEDNSFRRSAFLDRLNQWEKFR